MNKLLIGFGILLAVLLSFFLYAKNNILKNIDVNFKSIDIRNIRGLLPTIADIEVNFEVVNNSNFSFSLDGFKIKIYNDNTGEYLTENSVAQKLTITKGVSSHNVELVNNEVVGSITDFISGTTVYKMIISFKVLGVSTEFEQIVSL